MKRFDDAVRAAAMEFDKQRLDVIKNDLRGEYAKTICNLNIISKRIKISEILGDDTKALVKDFDGTSDLRCRMEELLQKIDEVIAVINL